MPLFVPPLVAGVAWSILGSPKSGLLNTMMKWIGLDWRIDLYSMAGLIVVFGMYYAPYVYMFTASALRNMDPSLEEAAEIAGVGPVRTLFTVTFPLIAPAIISGMLLSFIVMLGIYGIPAVLGAPANISVLTTYIFKLTNWSPPLYSTAAAVAIILMVVTGVLVLLQQRVLARPQLHHRRRQGVPPARARSRALALADARARAALPRSSSSCCRRSRLIVAAFRRFLFIPDAASLFDMRHYSLVHFEQHLRQPAHHALDLEHHGGRAGDGGARRRCSRSRSATPCIAAARPDDARSTSSPRCRWRSRAW